MGIEAYRTGSAPDRRQVSGRLAFRPHEAAGRDLAGVDHARISWLYDARLDTSHIEGKIITLRRLGVPYPEGFERQAEGHLKAQASAISAGLVRGGFDAPADREIVALIAYMQRLGTDIASRPAAADAGPALPAAGRTGGGQ